MQKKKRLKKIFYLFFKSKENVLLIYASPVKKKNKKIFWILTMLFGKFPLHCGWGTLMPPSLLSSHLTEHDPGP